MCAGWGTGGLGGKCNSYVRDQKELPMGRMFVWWEKRLLIKYQKFKNETVSKNSQNTHPKKLLLDLEWLEI